MSSSPIPSYGSTTLSDRKILFTMIGAEQGPDVVLDSGNTDANNTPATRFRAGNVVVLRTSTGRYVEANDTNGDRNAAASINTLITNPGSGGWDGNLVISGHWGTITVALSGDNTDAAVATAINAAVAAQNPESQARITAADATGSVSITNWDVGSGTHLDAYHATVSTMFGAQDVTTAYGTDADYLVTGSPADLVDEAGTAQHAVAPTYRSGHFVLANLINLTGEAKAVLERRGSRFVA